MALFFLNQIKILIYNNIQAFLVRKFSDYFHNLAFKMYKKFIELENLCNSKCIILYIIILIYTHESILTYCEYFDLFQTNTKMLDRPLKEYYFLHKYFSTLLAENL